MAVVACRECGKPVSTKAHACPSCGAPTKRRTSMFTWIVGGFFTVAVVLAIVMSEISRRDKDERDAQAAQQAAARVAAMTPEQRAAEAAKRAAETKRAEQREAAFRRALITAKAIRESANDPDSISFHRVSYSEQGAVLLEYRGKNAFGGLIRQTAILAPDNKLSMGAEDSRDVVTAWNKYVAGKQMWELPKP